MRLDTYCISIIVKNNISTNPEQLPLELHEKIAAVKMVNGNFEATIKTLMKFVTIFLSF